jgi:hypothetical protein
MIQRKQTLYLLLVLVINLVLILFNVNVTKGLLRVTDIDSDKAYFYELGIVKTTVKTEPINEFTNGSLMYSVIAVALISFIAIFLFKKLPLQMRLVAFNFLFILLVWFNMIYQIYKLNRTSSIELVSSDLNYVTLFIPAILLLFNLLAFKGIKKDIELLASVDRLR